MKGGANMYLMNKQTPIVNGPIPAYCFEACEGTCTAGCADLCYVWCGKCTGGNHYEG